MPDSPYRMLEVYHGNYADEIGEDFDTFMKRIHESGDENLVEDMATYMYNDKYSDYKRDDYDQKIGLADWRDSHNPSFLNSWGEKLWNLIDSDDVDTDKGIMEEAWNSLWLSAGRQNLEMMGGTMEAVGRFVGSSGIANAGENFTKWVDSVDWGSAEPASVQSFMDIDDIEDGIRYVVSGAMQAGGSMIPVIGASVGGAAIAGAVAAPTGPGAGLAATVGGIGGGFLASSALVGGEAFQQIRDELKRDGMEHEEASNIAAQYAVPLMPVLAGIDLAGARGAMKGFTAARKQAVVQKTLDKIKKQIAEGAEGLTKKQAADFAEKKVAAEAATAVAKEAADKVAKRGFAKSVGVGMASEGATEAVQSAVRETAAAHATDDPDFANRLTNIVNEGLIGSFGGGMISGGSHLAGKAMRRGKGAPEGVPPPGETEVQPEDEVGPAPEEEAGPVETPTADDAQMEEFGRLWTEKHNEIQEALPAILQEWDAAGEDALGLIEDSYPGLPTLLTYMRSEGYSPGEMHYAMNHMLVREAIESGENPNLDRQAALQQLQTIEYELFQGFSGKHAGLVEQGGMVPAFPPEAEEAPGAEPAPEVERPAGAEVDSRQLEIEAEQGKRRLVDPATVNVGDRVLVDNRRDRPAIGKVVDVVESEGGGRRVVIHDDEGNPFSMIDTGDPNADAPNLYTIQPGRTPAEEVEVQDPETEKYRGELARVRRRLKDNPEEGTSLDALRKLRGNKEFTNLTEAERDEIDNELSRLEAAAAEAEEAAKATPKPKVTPKKPKPAPEPEAKAEPEPAPAPEPEPEVEPEPEPAPEPEARAEPEPAPKPTANVPPEEEATPASEEPAPSLKPLDASVLPGSEAQSVTPGREMTVDTVMAVVEVDDLVVSHTETGAENPAFPSGLQPRDRSSQSSRMQISEMAADLDFGLLYQSPTTDVGAPIVSPEDSVVESGNGRIMAIQRAYRQNPESAARYRARVEEEASAAGIDASGFQKPIIVRLRRTDVDRETFTRASNERSTKQMTAVEQAMQDASLIDDDLMLKYRSSNLDSPANNDFRRSFLLKIPKSEHGNLVNDSNGLASPTFKTRVANAILWKAYQDKRLLIQRADQANLEGQKRVLAALEEAAPAFARARAAGFNEPGEVVADAAEILYFIHQKRDAYGSLANLINQEEFSFGDSSLPGEAGKIIGDKNSDAVKVALALEARRNSGAKMVNFLRSIVELVEAESDRRLLNTVDAFGMDEASISDVIAGAIGAAQKDLAPLGQQGTLGPMWQDRRTPEEKAAEAAAEAAAAEPVAEVEDAPATLEDFNEDELLGLADEGVIDDTFYQKFSVFDDSKAVLAIEQDDLSVLSDRELLDFAYRLKQEFMRERENGNEHSARAEWLRSAMRRTSAEIKKRKRGPEALRLDEAGLMVDKDGDGYLVTGKTFDNKDKLNQLGGYYDDERKAWRFDEDPTAKIAGALGPSEKPAVQSKVRRTIEEEFTTGTESIAPEIDADAILSQKTKDLLARGSKVGIPDQVLGWQAEDAALIVDAHQQGRGMFLLASQAGSGKTFVLGAAIRELQSRGVKDIVYVTMNKALIAQNQKDLGDFLTSPIRWMTYADIRGKKAAENAASITPDTVLIFDESHNIKNTSSKGGQLAGDMMETANFTVMASATAFENPTEAEYLGATGVFGDTKQRKQWSGSPTSPFNLWAAKHGAEIVNVGEPGFEVWVPVWRGSVTNALAAQRDLVSRKVYSYRPLQLPKDSTDTAFTRTTVNDAAVGMWYRVRSAYDWALAAAGGDRFTLREVAAHKSGRLNRIMEAAKIDQAVEQVKAARAEGRHVVIFTQTKAPTHIGRFRLNEKYRQHHGIRGKEAERTYTPTEVEQMLIEYAEKWGNKYRRPPPPFSGGVALVAKAFGRFQIDFPLPSVPDALKDALGDEAVLYTGGQSDAENARAKADFLSGKKPIIIATMDKGGTGLSLHDTVGDAPRTLIGINLPWTATKMDQALGRVTRYGMKSKSVVDWLYAENIPYEGYVAERVQTRMETMGAVLRGEPPVISNLLMEEMKRPERKSQRVDELMSRAPAHQVPPHLNPSIEKDIKELAARLAPTVSISVAPELHAPTNLTHTPQEGQKVQGYYQSPGNKLGLLTSQKIGLIRVALNSNDPLATLRHEVIHALRDLGLITEKEWATLIQAAKKEKWIETFNIRKRYPDFFTDDGTPTELAYEEAIADAFGSWISPKQLTVITGGDPQVMESLNLAGRQAHDRIARLHARRLAKRPMIVRVFKRIAEFFKNLGRMLSGYGHTPHWESVFEKVESGEVGARGINNRESFLTLANRRRDPVKYAIAKARAHEKLSQAVAQQQELGLEELPRHQMMVAVHVMSVDDMLRVLMRGGELISPSIAIVRADMLHEWPGEIKVVFKSGVADPAKMSTKLGDAWTAIFPLEYKLVAKKKDRDSVNKKFRDDFLALPPEFQELAGINAVREIQNGTSRVLSEDGLFTFDTHGITDQHLPGVKHDSVQISILRAMYAARLLPTLPPKFASRRGPAMERYARQMWYDDARMPVYFKRWAEQYLAELVPESLKSITVQNLSGDGPKYVPNTNENIMANMRAQKERRVSSKEFGRLLSTHRREVDSIDKLRSRLHHIVPKRDLDTDTFSDLDVEAYEIVTDIASSMKERAQAQGLETAWDITPDVVYDAFMNNVKSEDVSNELKMKTGVLPDERSIWDMYNVITRGILLTVPFAEAKPDATIALDSISHVVANHTVSNKLIRRMEKAGLTVIQEDSTATDEEKLANQLGPDDGQRVMYSVFQPDDSIVTFEDQDTENRWREAAEGAQDTSNFISNWARKRWNRLTRHREHMANTLANADVIEKMMHLENAKQVALEEVKSLYNRVMGKGLPDPHKLRKERRALTGPEADLLTRKFVLEDLKWTAEQGMNIPFNLQSVDQVFLELRKVNAVLAERPDLRERVMVREEAVRKLRDEMVEVGILTEASARNPAYFRHQVLEYAAVRGYGASGDKVRNPYWHRREGSEKDINVNYFEVEAEWMMKAYQDIATQKFINWLRTSKYNHRPSMVKAAKKDNQSALLNALSKEALGRLDKKQRARLMDGVTTPIQFARRFKELRDIDPKMAEVYADLRLLQAFDAFRISIARGLSDVRKGLAGRVEEIENLVPRNLKPQVRNLLRGEGNQGINDDAEQAPIFGVLSWLASTDAEEFSRARDGARKVLSAVARRRAWTQKEAIPDLYVNPMNTGALMGRYGGVDQVAWQPDSDGSTRAIHVFSAKTVPERILGRVQEALIESYNNFMDGGDGMMDPAIIAEMMTKVSDGLMLGGAKEEFVLDANLAQTLNEFHDDELSGQIDEIVVTATRAWKKWILFNPWRFAKYFLNNMSGDIDAIMANPNGSGIVSQIPRAARELYAYQVQGMPLKSSEPELLEALERGVLHSSLTTQEIQEMRPGQVDPELHFRGGNVRRAARGYFRAVQGTARYRENVVRYAAYLHYLQEFKSGKSQMEIGYGASPPHMVIGITDLNDKAARMARDALGDYGNLSVTATWARNRLMPFLSWIYSNTVRYNNLFANAYRYARDVSVTKGVAMGAWHAMTLTLRIGMFYTAVQTFNMLFFPDEEEELSVLDRLRMHLNLGKDSEGRNVMLRFQGALSDYLGWLGMESAGALIAEVHSGRASVGDVVESMAKAPVNRLAGALSPVYKLPMELISGRQFYPDIFEPRAIRDPWNHALRTFTLHREYDEIRKALGGTKPTRGYLDAIPEALVYRKDPGEMAYDNIRSLAYEWQRRERGTVGSFGVRTPRSDLLRDLRMAKRMGDEVAARNARLKMRKLRMRNRDVRGSLRRAHPTGMLTQQERRQFVRTLSPRERAMLTRGLRWYNRTLRGGG